MSPQRTPCVFIIVALAAQYCTAEVLRGRADTKSLNLPLEVTSFESTVSRSDVSESHDKHEPYRFSERGALPHPAGISKLSLKHGNASTTLPNIQFYEAFLPEMTSVVLNVYAGWSSGAGGLVLALEVPSPCPSEDGQWVTIDTKRCSAEYPCALRLPANAIPQEASHGRRVRPQLTRFRTRVVEEDDDYGTDAITYSRITVEMENVAVVASSDRDYMAPAKVRRFEFNLSQAMASGSLQVVPYVLGATEHTRVTMKMRQRDVKVTKFPHADQWRTPSADLDGCSFRHFEVVADGLFEGPVELEVEMTDGESLGKVVIFSRVGLAEAEANLLDEVLHAHSNFFLDPEEVIHGLPMTTINPTDPGRYAWSNPTEWGFTLTAWAIYSELEWLTKEEARAKIANSLQTMDQLQADPEQFAKGMFFPYYKLRNTNQGDPRYGSKLDKPERTNYLELPCGDNALLYSSVTLVRGWLLSHKFLAEAELAENITSKLDFSKCLHRKECPDDAATNFTGERAWSVAMTVNSKTGSLFPYDWNVWADEGGVVGLVTMLSESMDMDKFLSMQEEQHKYSPCETWQNITVENTAYFNSVFTLPTRSFLGMGTLFSSKTFHDFSVRSVLPTFRAHRATKSIVGDDFFGPSDAMSQGIGSVAFFPPNTQYRPCAPETSSFNKCTWCEGLQYFDSGEKHHLSIPHGSLVSFLALGTMETSQMQGWVEDLKLMMSDASGTYNASYGFEVLGPTRRTSLHASFLASDVKTHGTGFFEALAHSYTTLSIYEGMAAMRRRFELLRDEGAEIRGTEPWNRYRPLSDFLDAVPHQRQRIDKLLAIASTFENPKTCELSDFGPSAHQGRNSLNF